MRCPRHAVLPGLDPGAPAARVSPETYFTRPRKAFKILTPSNVLGALGSTPWLHVQTGSLGSCVDKKDRGLERNQRLTSFWYISSPMLLVVAEKKKEQMIKKQGCSTPRERERERERENERLQRLTGYGKSGGKHKDRLVVQILQQLTFGTTPRVNLSIFSPGVQSGGVLGRARLLRKLASCLTCFRT